MAVRSGEDRELALRARDWRRSALAATCDVIEPWQYGTVVRATRYPEYYDFNAVQVEQEPEMEVDELIAFADQALRGLAHRRIDFESIDSGAARRAEFEACGWRTMCLVRLRHEGVVPDPATGEPTVTVEEVPYDAVHELRAAWHEEDFPGVDASAYFGYAREVALTRGIVVLAVRRGRRPIAFAEIERAGDGAEVTSVYVRAEERGHGLGTAVTRAALAAAPAVRDLWITADDEDRPKHLYVRLGFRPAWRSIEFLRLPRSGP